MESYRYDLEMFGCFFYFIDECFWLMVSFALFQALLHSVPIGRLVVLDLFAEVKPIWNTSEQFYGVPYIW
jgi:hypothetical protein